MLYQFFLQANDDNKLKSSQGLMVLFAIGILPKLLGLSFDSALLKNLGLTGINITHPENLVLIYSIVVVYSVYRFYLANIDLRLFCYAKNLEVFLKSSVGKLFLNRLLFIKTVNQNIKFSYVENEGKSEITVTGCANSDDFDISEKCILESFVPGKYDIKINWKEGEAHPFEKRMKFWGLDKEYDTGEFKEQSAYGAIGSPLCRLILFIGCTLYMLKSAMVERTCLDFYIPIACNTMFVTFLMFERVI